MKIGINASFLRKPNTGIGQVTASFLEKLGELKTGDKKLKTAEFILYLEEEPPKNFRLPKNFSQKIFLPVYRRDDLIRKIWWEKFLLPSQVKKDKCDIFISLYQCPTVFEKSIKHIMLVHDIIPKIFPGYLDNWRKKIYWQLTEKGITRADKIMTVSKKTEKDLINHLKIDGEKIATNYIDANEIYKVETQHVASLRERNILKKYKLKPGYILAGGGYEIRKNVAGAIRAYRMLLEKNKKEHFLKEFPRMVIYGKILPRNLTLAMDVRKLLKELNLTKYVKLLGEIPQRDLPALFKNSVLFVYPSFYEGFGLPVLEAMNVGVPVITSKISSLPEVGGDGVLYCNPKDVSDIAMVMKNILTNRNLREQLKFRGYERSKQFSWEKFTEKVWNIISEM